MSQKAVFLDRDGVINRDYGYVGSVDRFEFLPGVIDSLAKLKQMGYLTILVTNQSGIARGMFTIEDFNAVTDYMQKTLEQSNAKIDGVYFCPHHVDAQVEEFRCDCSCRKPKPSMFFWARNEFDIDMSASVMIGDHASDIEAAVVAEVGSLFLVGDHIQTESKLVPKSTKCFKDLAEATAYLQSLANN